MPRFLSLYKTPFLTGRAMNIMARLFVSFIPLPEKKNSCLNRRPFLNQCVILSKN